MHPKHFARRGAPLSFTLALALLALQSLAQTGPALLVKPWPEKEQFFDGKVEGFFSNAGHIKETGDHFRLTEIESIGRFRIIPGSEISPRIGYEASFFDLHTNDKRLPDQLTDVSVALGSGVFKNGNWIGAVTLGVGYSGSNAFGNGAGWYGKADAILVNQISEDDYLGIVLDYDGHRTFAPDIPIPGFGYSHRFDPKLQVVVGFPYSTVSWKPIEHLDIEAEYAVLTDVRANISYEVIKHLSVYALTDIRRDAFHVDGLPRNQRLLFENRRVEAGVKYTPIPLVTVGVGIGYGFTGNFVRGFDYRDTHKVDKFSDEPYVRAEVEMRF